MLKYPVVAALLLCLFACSEAIEEDVLILKPAARFVPYECQIIVTSSTGEPPPIPKGGPPKLTGDVPETFKAFGVGKLMGVPRSPAREYRFAVGKAQCSLKVVEQPHALPDVPVACDYACACTFNGKVYLFGGRTDAAIFTGYANRYDPVSKKWEGLPGMVHPKERASAAALGGKIYVIGGYSGEESVLVDVFDPQEKAWSEGPMLSTARYAGCAAVVGGKIYYIGGWISCHHEVSDG